MPDHGDTKELVDEFLGTIDAVYGLYLDTTTGFRYWEAKFKEAQEQGAKKVNLTIEELDKTELIYGRGDPNVNMTVLNKGTQGEFKERIKKNSTNDYAIAAACLVMMYQYWEDHYRARIAHQIGVTKDDIK